MDRTSIDNENDETRMPEGSSDDEERRRKWWFFRKKSRAETSIPAPVPCRTSILRGQMWVDELLRGHPARIWEQLSIGKRAFKKLCNLLVEKGA